MEKKTISILAIALSGAAFAETVEIRSAADWDNFAKRVNTYSDVQLDAKLMNNVTLSASSPRVGDSSAHAYRGTFDGDGHTLTVNINVTNAGKTNPAAPFAYFSDGCTVKNLHVAGTIRTDGKFAGGILGHSLLIGSGDVELACCRVSAAITCTVSGDATAGGLIGCSENSYPDISITDCLFDGSMEGPSANSCGGFAGYRRTAYIRTYNCLFDPASWTVDAESGYTLVRPSYSLASHLVNTWYTFVYGTAQGSDGRGKTAEELAAALGDNWTVAGGKAMLKQFAVPSTPPEPLPEGAFSYQGVLRDAKGNALAAKDHTIVFSIYDQATGGSPHWSRAVDVLLDDDGLFNVEISDVSGEAVEGQTGTGLAGVITANAGTTLYIGLSVDGSPEIAPRQRLVAAPLAIHAADSASASGDMAAAGALSAATLEVKGDAAVKSVAASGNATAGRVASTGAVSGYGTIPVGGIITWSGAASAIPDGWALCNGQTVNGRYTPNLSDRFIVGAGGTYSRGTIGGAKEVSLTLAEMPSHRHEYKYRSYDLVLSWKNQRHFYTVSQGSIDQSAYTEYTGGNQPHENRPPYYALCYIMRVK